MFFFFFVSISLTCRDTVMDVVPTRLCFLIIEIAYWFDLGMKLTPSCSLGCDLCCILAATLGPGLISENKKNCRNTTVPQFAHLTQSNFIIDSPRHADFAIAYRANSNIWDCVFALSSAFSLHLSGSAKLKKIDNISIIHVRTLQ